jgi:2-phospho-L-lactate guanylyltransferase (CobY/MobA/RfbA family)
MTQEEATRFLEARAAKAQQRDLADSRPRIVVYADLGLYADEHIRHAQSYANAADD